MMLQMPTCADYITNAVLHAREVGYSPDAIRQMVEAALKADADVDAELGKPEIVVALHATKTRIGVLEVREEARIYSSGVTTEPPGPPVLPQPMRVID